MDESKPFWKSTKKKIVPTATQMPVSMDQRTPDADDD